MLLKFLIKDLSSEVKNLFSLLAYFNVVSREVPPPFSSGACIKNSFVLSSLPPSDNFT